MQFKRSTPKLVQGPGAVNTKPTLPKPQQPIRPMPAQYHPAPARFNAAPPDPTRVVPPPQQYRVQPQEPQDFVGWLKTPEGRRLQAQELYTAGTPGARDQAWQRLREHYTAATAPKPAEPLWLPTPEQKAALLNAQAEAMNAQNRAAREAFEAQRKQDGAQLAAMVRYGHPNAANIIGNLKQAAMAGDINAYEILREAGV